MKITSLVENTTTSGFKTKHGLSLYIETEKHTVLFDLGPDGTLFENAAKRGVDLAKVDTVIISHGHSDHGGALKAFLDRNSAAKVYVQRSAFAPHYSRLLCLNIPVGLDETLRTHRQIVLLDGDCRIDDELTLFTVPKTDRLFSPVNRVLYDAQGRDTFAHEQNLVISEHQTALIMGCGHAGIANILEKAQAYRPKLCIGGFHLWNPTTKKTVSRALLRGIAAELQQYPDTEFYTCHCTGKTAYRYLAKQLPNMHYFACGDSMTR